MRSKGYGVVADSKQKVLCKKPRAGSRKFSQNAYAMKPKEFAYLKEQWGSVWEQGDMAYNPNLWEGDGRFTFRKKARN